MTQVYFCIFASQLFSGITGKYSYVESKRKSNFIEIIHHCMDFWHIKVPMWSISTRVFFMYYLLRCSSDTECNACQYDVTGSGNCLLIVLEQDAETFMAAELIHIYKRGKTNKSLISNKPWRKKVLSYILIWHAFNILKW